MIDIPFRSKEVSWLSFNSRVLQEAQSDDVPLLERLKFLGIYSSNLDEFFRVRVATLRRIIALEVPYEDIGIPDPVKTLRQVNKILKKESEVFNTAYADVFKKLEGEGIRLINSEAEVPKRAVAHLDEFFMNKVFPRLMPIMVSAESELEGLQDNPMYLAVELSGKKGGGWPAHALIEIPSDLPRFFQLQAPGKTKLVMYLDDVIRHGLPKVFRSTPYTKFDSYALKFTRDAEMEMDSDFTESFYEQISEGLKSRQAGQPVRVNFDQAMPSRFLDRVLKALQFSAEDSQFPGARYHNRKDLIKFPSLDRSDLLYEKLPPIPHPTFGDGAPDMLKLIAAKDQLLYFPYHSFDRFIDLLRQASIDPDVRRIKMTQYRLASSSCVAHALMTAVRNGKEVTVLVEPTARFDEEANIAWAAKYRSCGINVILGVPGLKVHAKLCLITRMERGKLRHYSCIGTGNFNEDTARIYTDHMLMTGERGIGRDVERVFRFFVRNYQIPKLKHLICAPFDLRETIYEMIDNEIAAAKRDEKAVIWIKINNLSDVDTVRRLYDAADAGVKIRFIVRSMFSFVQGTSKKHENVEAVGIVDKFLEHTRVLVFHHGGDKRYFLSSADFLARNFDSRCEVVCPVYDQELQKQLDEFLQLQWDDNVKARILDTNLTNQVRHDADAEKPIRSQFAMEKLLRKKSRGK